MEADVVRATTIGAVLLVTLAAAPVAAQGLGYEEADVEAEEELLPYRGTSIIYENALAALTLDPSAELYYNPTYVMSWIFRPRWYLYDTLSARLDFSVESELTNSDWTQTRYEPIVSDLSLGFIYADFYAIPVVDVKLGGGVWLGFPTSKASQARTLYMSVAPTFSMRRKFDVLAGVEVSYSFRYTKNLNRYTTLQAEEAAFPCPLNVGDRTECYNLGTRNSSMSFWNTLAVDAYFIERLYASATVRVTNTLLYPLSTAAVDTIGGPVDVPPASDNTDHRGSMLYGVEVGYDATDYLTVALGSVTANPMLDEAGGIRTPFFNRYTNVYLDLALSVDGLVKTLTGPDEGAADETASHDSGQTASRW